MAFLSIIEIDSDHNHIKRLYIGSIVSIKECRLLLKVSSEGTRISQDSYLSGSIE